MAIYNCKKCGGNLKIIDQISGLCKCEYCRSTQTIPLDNDEKKVNLYNTANKYRRANQFDHALDIYQSMIKEFPDEAESYWGAVLCRFGIEYVVDPKPYYRLDFNKKSEYYIGREGQRDNDISIIDKEETKGISRSHAIIRFDTNKRLFVLVVEKAGDPRYKTITRIGDKIIGDKFERKLSNDDLIVVSDGKHDLIKMRFKIK
jgi:hypothetical protein